MARKVPCGVCGRKFGGLNAYLWHLRPEVTGACVPKPKPGPVHICYTPYIETRPCPACPKSWGGLLPG